MSFNPFQQNGKETQGINFLGSILGSTWSIIGYFTSFYIGSMDLSLVLAVRIVDYLI